MSDTSNPTITPEANQALHAGQIYWANESRFNAHHYSEALTAYTVGWKDQEPLMQLLDFIAPPVYVGRRFEFKRADQSECFLSEADDIRAPGAAFKRVEYTGSSVYEKTLNKGLTMRIDHDDIAGEDWQERYVQLLLKRLCRNEFKRALSALLGLKGHTQTLNWQGEKATSPDADILNHIIQTGNLQGVEPTRALYGRSAWQKRHQYYATQNQAGAFAGLLMSPVELATTVGLDAIQVAKERVDSPEGKHLSNYVMLFNGQQNPDKDDPSNLKRFITPTQQGLFRVFVEEHAKYTDICVEHYSNIVVTSTLGICQLTIQ